MIRIRKVPAARPDDRRLHIFRDRPLGIGGEGSVFLGFRYATGTYCAVKLSNCLDPSEKRRHLAHEWRRRQRVVGSRIARLVGKNLTCANPFLLFELAHGSLKDEMDFVKANGLVFNPSYALFRLRQILVALAQTHQSGIVHRDVKPGNFLYFEGNTLKISDFGSGRTRDAVMRNPWATFTRAVVGTRMYAAPEQLARRHVDHRADLYSAGAILYEMLTQYAPPPPNRRRLPPSVFNRGIGRRLNAFTAWLLAPDPRQRPRSAFEAIRVLDGIYRLYARKRLRLA